ncbi:MAG: hypothetical protein WKG07_27855 [Hymenobacter sp.]
MEAYQKQAPSLTPEQRAAAEQKLQAQQQQFRRAAAEAAGPGPGRRRQAYAARVGQREQEGGSLRQPTATSSS